MIWTFDLYKNLEQHRYCISKQGTKNHACKAKLVQIVGGTSSAIVSAFLFAVVFADCVISRSLYPVAGGVEITPFGSVDASKLE